MRERYGIDLRKCHLQSNVMVFELPSLKSFVMILSLSGNMKELIFISQG